MKKIGTITLGYDFKYTLWSKCYRYNDTNYGILFFNCPITYSEKIMEILDNTYFKLYGIKFKRKINIYKNKYTFGVLSQSAKIYITRPLEKMNELIKKLKEIKSDFVKLDFKYDDFDVVISHEIIKNI